MDPVVTIIIPTYNHAGYLREALASVVAQNFHDWEAIVVNNFSEDDTVAAVESFADSRIRLENFRNNGVIGASRNRGIALARGRYIAFLDSDDAWLPGKLARCIPYLEQGAHLVSHGLRYIGERSGEMYCGPAHRASVNALLDHGSCITPSATIVRKLALESVGCFSENPAVVTSEDYHLWIKLACNGARMEFIREILGEYRIHEGNQSGSVMRHLNSVLSVLEEFKLQPAGKRISPVRLRKRQGLAYYGAARGMQKNGQFLVAAGLYLKALFHRPFLLQSYVFSTLNILAFLSSRVQRLKPNDSR